MSVIDLQMTSSVEPIYQWDLPPREWVRHHQLLSLDWMRKALNQITAAKKVKKDRGLEPLSHVYHAVIACLSKLTHYTPRRLLFQSDESLIS